MFKHGKITHEYGLSYARGIPYYTLRQMQQSVANVQKLYRKKLNLLPGGILWEVGLGSRKEDFLDSDGKCDSPPRILSIP